MKYHTIPLDVMKWHNLNHAYMGDSIKQKQITGQILLSTKKMLCDHTLHPQQKLTKQIIFFTNKFTNSPKIYGILLTNQGISGGNTRSLMIY